MILIGFKIMLGAIGASFFMGVFFLCIIVVSAILIRWIADRDYKKNKDKK